jgi:deoxyribonuclease V
MLASLDVHYRADGTATAGCVLFSGWTDAHPATELVEHVSRVAPYEPGAFYLRELPPLIAALRRVSVRLEAVVIDGYVWLGDESRPGLGARLYAALQEKVPVIGVAKTPFGPSRRAIEVLRGKSSKPLYVTAAGVDAAQAAKWVASMHGAHRIPTLLARADRLSRT